jgi:hypothetical protein
MIPLTARCNSPWRTSAWQSATGHSRRPKLQFRPSRLNFSINQCLVRSWRSRRDQNNPRRTSTSSRASPILDLVRINPAISNAQRIISRTIPNDRNCIATIGPAGSIMGIAAHCRQNRPVRQHTPCHLPTVRWAALGRPSPNFIRACLAPCRLPAGCADLTLTAKPSFPGRWCRSWSRRRTPPPRSGAQA